MNFDGWQVGLVFRDAALAVYVGLTETVLGGYLRYDPRFEEKAAYVIALYIR